MIFTGELEESLTENIGLILYDYVIKNSMDSTELGNRVNLLLKKVTEKMQSIDPKFPSMQAVFDDDINNMVSRFEVHPITYNNFILFKVYVPFIDFTMASLSENQEISLSREWSKTIVEQIEEGIEKYQAARNLFSFKDREFLKGIGIRENKLYKNSFIKK